MKIKYLEKEILSWSASVESWSGGAKEHCQRPYEMLSYCEKLLSEKNDKKFKLADIVCWIRRILNHRLKTLSEIYKLNTISQSKKTLEILSDLKVVRPLLLKKLMDMRNLIEHADARPPSIKQCKEIIDITWYFLRSTDSLVSNIVSDVLFERCESNKTYWLSFDFKFMSKWFVNLRGWLPPNKLREKNRIGTEDIELKVMDCRSKKEKWNEIKRIKTHGGHDYDDEDIFLNAKAVMSSKVSELIIKKYFEISMLRS